MWTPRPLVTVQKAITWRREALGKSTDHCPAPPQRESPVNSASAERLPFARGALPGARPVRAASLREPLTVWGGQSVWGGRRSVGDRHGDKAVNYGCGCHVTVNKLLLWLGFWSS